MDSYSFRCESCQGSPSVRQIRKHEGCRRCGPTTWEISVTFSDVSEMDMLQTAAGLASLAVFGVGWTSRKRESFEVKYGGCPNEEIVGLCNYPKLEEGVLEYLAICHRREFDAHRQEMHNKGGQCGACGALFVPHAAKPWTAEGYCTKSCYSQAKKAPPPQQAEVKTAEINLNAALGEKFTCRQCGQVSMGNASKEWTVLQFCTKGCHAAFQGVRIIDLYPRQAPVAEQALKRATNLDVVCQSCHKEFNAPRTYAGMLRACPHCGAKNRVPDA